MVLSDYRTNQSGNEQTFHDGQGLVHLAIVDSHTLTMILDGNKTVETRFSLTKSAPFGRIKPGDIILFKISGGAIAGVARASRVKSYCDLTEDLVQFLEEQFNDAIQAKRDYWQKKKTARYGTLVELTDVRKARPTSMPFKKKDKRGWVVCGDLTGFEIETADETLMFAAK